MRMPGGGAPLAWVWRVRGRALSHPRLPALWTGCRGPLPTGCRCRGVRAWGPVTNATARALVSWLCTLWGRHEGARGGRLLPACGACGVGRSPTSDCLSSGRAAGAHYPLAVGAGGVRAWGPVTNPTARALASWLCALRGRQEGARGGASCLGVGRPGSGALPAPTVRPLGGLPGPASHWPWVRCAGVGARVSLAPCPVHRFVVCCARFPGLRHLVAVVAWHLSSCRGCGWRRASLACLVAMRRCAASRPVRSLSVLRSAFPSPWCLPPPRGLSPPALLGGSAGHLEAGREPVLMCLPLVPAEAGALGVLRVELFGAPRWG